MTQFFQMLLPIVLIGMMTLSPRAADVTLTLQPEQELNRIDEKIYGHFLEHIYNSVNGGLWGELVWNRSFEDNDGGGWSHESTTNIITQKSRGEDQRLVFGEKDWSDYEFTVETQKTGGAEGFLLLFRVQNDKEFSWANLGGWQNRQHGIERRSAAQNRQSGVGRMVDGSIETGKWYFIRVRCEGNNVKVFLDDQLILDVTDPNVAKTGSVGIGTWQTQAQFRNFKVTSLDGQNVLFNETPTVSQNVRIRHWEPWGDVTIALNTTDAFNGKASLQIIPTAPGVHTIGEHPIGGIQQRGINLKGGETYLLSLWAKQPGATNGINAIHFDFSSEADIRQRQTFNTLFDNSNRWTRLEIEITPDSAIFPDITQGIFRVITIGSNSILIDQVSIMPKSWAEKHDGFRPDLLNAIADLRPPTIRYPGGCFASAYRWKDGIGPQEKRQAFPFTIWDDRDVNSFGTDEFVQLCRRVGSEPIIVINTGTPMWNVRRTPATADVDWLQEACDWLEYCNGPATSKWGAVRAANGHPAPYNVKYWEIDNEIELSAEEYIATLKKFVPALKAIDPSIKIIACGSWRGDRMRFDAPVINEAGHLFEYISFHQYDNPNVYADGPGRIENYFRQLKEVIDKSPNKHVKIYDSEWNAQSTDWRTGLYAGGLLNVFERCGDFVTMAAPALFLRHARATAWDNAFINFDNKSWYPAPNYVVMKLWRAHYAPIRIGLDGDAKGLNAIATKSEDGNTFYFKAVNPTNETRNVTLNVGSGKASASMQLITATGLNDRNTFENPNAIAPKEVAVQRDGNTVKFELPAHSAGVVVVE